MKYTQNYKISQVTERTLIIGVDIAKKKHFARAFDWRGIELDKVINFSSNSKGFKEFDQWAQDVANTHGKDKIIVGLEPTGHYWFTFASYVSKRDKKIVQVNSYHVKKAKELDDNTPSKNDRKVLKLLQCLLKMEDI